MELPGGIRIGRALKRSFRFKPLTGELELCLSDAAQSSESLPARVTAVLSAALAVLGDKSPSMDLVRRLSVGDRQFLMQRLATHIDDAVVWLRAACGECGDLFEISFRQSELPAKPAGKAFPETEVQTSLGKLRARVPCGADQEAIAAIPDDDAALLALLKRLLRDHNSRPVDVRKLTPEDIERVEAVVEAMSAEVAAESQTRCPHCKAETTVSISPYRFLDTLPTQIFSEIHALAAGYHWSEQAILALPRTRRHIYLRLLDQSRGLLNSSTFPERGYG